MAIANSRQKNIFELVLIVLLTLITMSPTVAEAQTLESQNWESGWGGWTTDDSTVWQVGSPTSGPGVAFEGGNCTGTVLNGAYPATTSARLVSPTFTLPDSANHPFLRFYHWLEKGGDTAKVQISTDGVTWVDLTTEGADFNTWTYWWRDMQDYAGQTVQIGFLFASGTNTARTGWYIDNISVTNGVQGAIDWMTYWTKAESPYHVVGNVTVNGLDIEPGVEVRFHGNYSFDIAGTLTAIGTKQDSIYFTSGVSGVYWKRMFFDNTQPGSTLKYCVIAWAKNRGLVIVNSIPTIENCVIRNCYAAGEGGGLYVKLDVTTDTLVLRDCIIKNNNSGNYHGGGIRGILTSGVLHMINCEITNNKSNPNGAKDVDRVGGGGYISGTMIMDSCLVSGNGVTSYSTSSGKVRLGRGGGLFFSGGDVTIRNSKIQNNIADTRAINGSSAYSRGGGIYMSNSGTLTLENSIISRNESKSSGGWGGYFSYGGGVYSATNATITNCIIDNNIVSTYISPSGSSVKQGSGVYVEAGVVDIMNSNIVCNNYEGLHRAGGTLTVMNSIVFYNGSTEVAGAVSATWNDIQDGYGNPEDSNINVNPGFVCGDDSLSISQPSLCIDAGNPAMAYNDICFPPSLGTSRNDMGAHGGPGACGWGSQQAPAQILCPGNKEYAVCELGSEICITLPISNADSVYISSGNWSNDLFCFTPTDTGTYDFGIIAENSTSADTCTFVVHITQEQPLYFNTSQLIFAITETATSMPAPKYLRVSSPCADGISNWNAVLFSDGDWLRLDKSSGTNPDSIMLSIADSTAYTTGVYGAVIALKDAVTGEILTRANVALFVAPGTNVGSARTKPGNVIAVPLTINTNNDNPNDSVKGFTIPLKYFSNQLDKVVADSIVFDGTLLDNIVPVFDPINGVIIVDRPTQDPPLPDSTYLARIFFTIDSSTADEIIPIDLDTNNTYAYQFVQSTGVVDTPSFSPGEIVIESEPALPVITYNSNDLNATDIGRICIPITVTNYDWIRVSGDGSTAATWADNSLCLTTDTNGTYIIILEAMNSTGISSAVLPVVVSQTGIFEQGKDVLPQEYEMRQNYPNPFNPSTNIDFSLPKASQVTLEVFNINGQKVITLIDQHLAAGFYTVNWDSKSSSGNQLASGIYFYRLKATDFLKTKKMLLLK